MNRYLAIGLATVAGAALFEIALVPAVVIGGAALLAPNYLPRLRRKVQPAIDAITRPLARARPVASAPGSGVVQPSSLLPRFAIGRSLLKTVTFRAIVTVLDFTSNYIVLGELATAAGLSSFALVAGPVFYFVHETAWNYLGPGKSAVALPALRWPGAAEQEGHGGFTVSRALAKTITFRVVATVVDFTTIYIVVGDPLTALGLSAFGFVVGPFVYLGHEKLWDRYSPPEETAVEPPARMGDEVAAPAPAVRRLQIVEGVR